MASAANDYFDEVLNGGFTFIANLPIQADPVDETEWRDFKLYDPSREKDCRDKWSECLSAFANTGGGVVVWGVDARLDKVRGVDCVTKVVPIPEPMKWAEKLKRWLLDAANPPVSGVQIKTVTEAGSDEGFVICLIPESTHKPHRSEFATNKPYLIRVGDNCVVPNPALLRSMFFPQPSVDLWLIVESQVDPAFQTSQVRLKIENRGYTSMRNGLVRVIIHPDSPQRKTQVRANEADLIGSVNNRQVQFQMKHTELHPGMSSMFGHVQTNLRSIALTVFVYQSDCQPLRLNLELDFLREKDGKLQFAPLEESEHAALDKLLREVD